LIQCQKLHAAANLSTDCGQGWTKLRLLWGI